jgi:alpha-galactosidase
MVCVSAELTNLGSAPLSVDRLMSLSLPVPDWATQLTRFSGRWAGEMALAAQPLGQGRWEAVARGGRPGFGGGNWLLVGEAGCSADYGRMIGAHLAWSGGHDCGVEQNPDGETRLQLGCHLLLGEITLAPGGSFRTPEACFAFSAHGRNGLRRAFHEHLRRNVLPGKTTVWPARKVHLNSWEALGFALDERSAMSLATAAADLGVERFVLDDGWFAGRTSDRSSLGDWSADPLRFPRGLAPLIAHVRGLGMEFGLWVEPEMISPDSHLHGAHPDWCIHLDGHARLTQRHQLVLDLSKAEVFDHVLTTLTAILEGHDIAYLKWDHNRELFPSPQGHAQAEAVLRLVGEVRTRFPEVEIEGCASGGGRISFDMLGHVHRVWPSDNNDPVERLRIISAWSQFLPAEVLGSHVGPAVNPITGRHTPMDFRAAVATLGHMGVEADPATMTAEERAVLKLAIDRYKEWRDVLHQGEWRELDLALAGAFGHLVLGGERSLALVASTAFARAFNAPRVRIPGFSSNDIFRVRLLEPWPSKASGYLNDPQGWRDGRLLSGAALAESGLALPLTHPHSAWLIGIERVAQ